MRKRKKRRVYTQAQINYVARTIPGTSYAEMTRLFNKRFNEHVTFHAIKSLLRKHGLVNGFGNGNPTSRVYQDVHIRFIAKNIKGRSYEEMRKLFNKHFELRINIDQMKGILGNYGLTNGRDTRFKPGHPSHNKGKKGIYYPGSEKGWFRPGHPGYKMNERSVGSERVNVDGYVEVKISDKQATTARERQKRWKAKHVIIWEKAHGKVPPRHVVLFQDGNRMNFKLKNLILVSRKELAVLNHMKFLSTNSVDIKKVAVSVVRLKVLTAERKKETFSTGGNRALVVIDNAGKEVWVQKDPKTGKYKAVRNFKGEVVPLRTKKIKPKKTIGEARQALIEYALNRGWQRL